MSNVTATDKTGTTVLTCRTVFQMTEQAGTAGRTFGTSPAAFVTVVTNATQFRVIFTDTTTWTMPFTDTFVAQFAVITVSVVTF